MSRIGVVTGSRAEGHCLPGLEGQIACTGADAGRARRAVAGLIEDGVRGLVSFGLAGALISDLEPGDLVLPESVILPNGRRAEVDAAWRARLDALARTAGLEPRCGPLLGSDELIATPDAKADEYRRTGALAVDMESHAVAPAALAAGLPFVVIRTVADPADQALPAAARIALDAEGRVRAQAITWALLRRPSDLPALLRLARQSRWGLRTLRRVAALAGSPLGFR